MQRETKFFVNNLLFENHCIIEMIRWTGLAPWHFEFPFPGSLRSTFLVGVQDHRLLVGSGCAFPGYLALCAGFSDASDAAASDGIRLDGAPA